MINPRRRRADAGVIGSRTAVQAPVQEPSGYLLQLGTNDLAPTRAAEMTVDLSVWAYRRLWRSGLDVRRGRYDGGRTEAWLIRAVSRPGRAIRSARWWRLNQYTPGAASLGVPDGSAQSGLAGPTRGSVSGLRHSLSGEN